MEVQSGTLASVQHSPSGRQLVPPSLATLSLPLSLGLWHFQGSAVGCLLAHSTAHPHSALAAEERTWLPTLCPVNTHCPALLLCAAFHVCAPPPVNDGYSFV